MKKLILASVMVLAVGGCAAQVRLHTEIYEQPQKVDSITVGQFTTKNPVDGQLVADFLRLELLHRGISPAVNAKYSVDGTIDFISEGVATAIVTVRDESMKPLIVWFYSDSRKEMPGFLRNRDRFAVYMAEQIAGEIKK